ncbi:MAG: hypothetical protein U9532_01365 ['Conium maculatum' witches'-broom phytoplasma]|nr:hypothetical protein ['Conium maculatum' witches'-broom phytoplasma]
MNGQLLNFQVLNYNALVLLFVIGINICFFNIGYKRGQTGKFMTNGKFLTLTLLLLPIALGYLKGMKDYLNHVMRKNGTIPEVVIPDGNPFESYNH